MEAVWTCETLVCYHNTTMVSQHGLNLKMELAWTFETLLGFLLLSLLLCISLLFLISSLLYIYSELLI